MYELVTHDGTHARLEQRTPEVASLLASFTRMKEASRREPPPTLEQRLDRLDRLARVIKSHEDEITRAVSRDFGNRSVQETRIADVMMLLDGIRYTRKNLAGWMKPQTRDVSMTYRPARAKVHFEPLGVVGIISPWNYPVQLALGPAVAAIAAGNRVLVKPSEYTPETSELLVRLCAEAFAPEEVAVATGGPEVGEAFSYLPFDHILYTGSTAIGRKVMKAAAENLVPVTLELGGKSPAIVHESYPAEKAASRIVWGKWLNAGQTCIAPDYLLVPDSKVDAYVGAIVEKAQSFYPTILDNADYTSMIDERHYRRVLDLVEDAVEKGARRIEVKPADEVLSPESRKIPPTLLVGANDEMRVMQEEIFGPVLPIVPYEGVDEAIDYVNDHPRPLALYYFDDDKDRTAQMIQRTTSGGVAVNETLLHFGIDDLPFGGVGSSGMGAYHGREGFETFSHKRGVLYQARWNALGLLSPPYGKVVDRLLALLIR